MKKVIPLIWILSFAFQSYSQNVVSNGALKVSRAVNARMKQASTMDILLAGMCQIMATLQIIFIHVRHPVQTITQDQM